MIAIRNALGSDRNDILDFCKNTFSWGDYIDQVWDLWVNDSAGQLFVAESMRTRITAVQESLTRLSKRCCALASKKEFQALLQ